jgi:hypothetical protein
MLSLRSYIRLNCRSGRGRASRSCGSGFRDCRSACECAGRQFDPCTASGERGTDDRIAGGLMSKLGTRAGGVRSNAVITGSRNQADVR